MTWTVLIAIITLTLHVAVVGLFAFLSLQDRNRFLRLWALAWVAQVVPSVALLRFEGTSYSSIPGFYLLALHAPDLISAFLVSLGLDRFLGRRSHEIWLVAALAGLLWIGIGLRTKLPFYLTMVPYCLLVALTYARAGVVLLSRSREPGRALAGLALVALGLFELNRPFTGESRLLLAPVSGCGTLLQSLSAVGLMLLYFHRVRARVQAAQSRFGTIFRTMREGLALYELQRTPEGDPEDYVLLELNPAFEHIAGVSREAVLGRSPASIWGLPSSPFLDLYAGVAAGGAPRRFEAWFEELGRHLSVSAFCPEPGTFATAVTDITEQKRVEAELARHRDDLEGLVRERTREIEAANRLLASQHRVVATLNHMQEDLQACREPGETWPVLRWCVRQLFPGSSGALMVLRRGEGILETVERWGDAPPEGMPRPLDDCLALRDGKPVRTDPGGTSGPCAHACSSPGASLCLPLAAQGQDLGVLHLAMAGSEAALGSMQQEQRRLAAGMAEQFSMAYANLLLRQRLHHQSVRDELTGLFNRRYMEESLARELLRADRHGSPLGIIMLDIDHFKAVNDTHGHDLGDRVLHALGGFLPALVRGEDIACRYGGEEFILILPGASVEHTMRRAEEIRRLIRTRIAVPLPGGGELRISASLGVAVHPHHGGSPEGLLKAADEALYRSKRTGRDRVSLAEG